MPYPQKGVAQGLLFANSKDTLEESLSPSLKIVKEAIIDYEVPHGNIIFDNSLESIAEQGVLLINTSLTCQINYVGSHYYVWKNFTAKLLKNLSTYKPYLVWILFGSQAQMFKDCITKGHILTEYHPAYYARFQQKMPNKVFVEANRILQEQNNSKIEYYKENTEYSPIL